MPFLWESLGAAIRLIAALDPDVSQAVLTSLGTALVSTAIAGALAVPLAALIGANPTRFDHVLISVLNTSLALPTVVVGLVLYGILGRQGPLGEYRLLFTPYALVIGQSVLALPIVTSYAVSAIRAADPRILPTAATLGAGHVQATVLLLGEVKFPVIAAVIGGFGRVISEVGVAMMLGGNIRGYTRTMTTAIALETSKGEFAFGLALGLNLLLVALAVNLVFTWLQKR